jgi:hypothetical protein
MHGLRYLYSLLHLRVRMSFRSRRRSMVHGLCRRTSTPTHLGESPSPVRSLALKPNQLPIPAYYPAPWRHALQLNSTHQWETLTIRRSKKRKITDTLSPRDGNSTYAD